MIISVYFRCLFIKNTNNNNLIYVFYLKLKTIFNLKLSKHIEPNFAWNRFSFEINNYYVLIGMKLFHISFKYAHLLLWPTHGATYLGM